LILDINESVFLSLMGIAIRIDKKPPPYYNSGSNFLKIRGGIIVKHIEPPPETDISTNLVNFVFSVGITISVVDRTN
jgi:hypothetical protein